LKEDEIGRVCSMHGREDECIQGFGRKNRRKETTRKTNVDGRRIMNWILENLDRE
jgi:hypothetical protein